MKWIADRLVRPLAVTVIGLTVAACAGPGPQSVTGDDEVVFPLSYGFYTLNPPSFRIEPVAGAGPDSDLVLVFATVPGAINGTPSGGPLRSIPVQPGSTFEMRLPARLPERATRFASRSLEIEPGDTRVARLGTFHEYPEYGMFRGGGGFIEKQSGAPVLLVYFSNPASLTGVIDDPSGAYHYDVTVERAGWSWLVARERDDDRFAVRRYTGPLEAIEFAVLLPPMMLGSRGTLDRQAVGYVAICFGFSIEFGGRNAFIDEPYIEPGHRRRGIGGIALRQLAREAAGLGVRALHLQVAWDNVHARRLYAAADFVAREKYCLMSTDIEPES